MAGNLNYGNFEVWFSLLDFYTRLSSVFWHCSDNDSCSRGPYWPKVAAMTGARLMVGEYASWVILACIPVDASAQGTQQPKTRGDQRARKHMKNTS